MNNLVYLDFEADLKGTFFLATYRWAGQSRQFCLDARLTPAAEAHGLSIFTPLAFAEHIRSLCTEHDARVAAWSMAEQNTLEGLLGKTAPPTLNLLRQAKSWLWMSGRSAEFLPTDAFRRRRSFRQKQETWRLTRFSAWALNEAPPHGYAVGKVTSRIRDVLKGLERAGGWAGLTPVQKRKWSGVLGHNRWDTEVLERVAALIGAPSGADHPPTRRVTRKP